MEVLKNAAPDGYSIGIGQGGNLVVAPQHLQEDPYDPLKDFVPIARARTNYLPRRESQSASRPPPRWSPGQGESGS